MIARRALFLAAPLAVAGCAITGGGASVPALHDVQVWASNTVNSISALAQQLTAPGGPITDPKVIAQVRSYVPAAQAGLVALMSAVPASDVRSIVVEIIGIVQKVLPLLPVPAPLVLALQMGLTVLTSYVQAIPIVVPAVPAQLRQLSARYQASRR